MTLARFFDRVADASLAVLDDIDKQTLERHVGGLVVRLTVNPEAACVPGHDHGYLTLANLAARIYPAIHIDAPPDLADRASELILAINPACDLPSLSKPDAPAAAWGATPGDGTTLVATAAGWNVAVMDTLPLAAAAAPAAMVSASIAAGQLFRVALAPLLGAPPELTPAAWNVITCGPPVDRDGGPTEGIHVGRVALAGCGAVGEAFALALHASKPTGAMVAVDPETVELSNLQRYALARDGDEGAAKPGLVARAFAESAFDVAERTERWSAALCDDVDAVVVALDTPEDRIAVAAGLPRAIYNGYTGPMEVGVSRHERFGVDPCLACLYWPLGTKPPARHEQIANSLGEHPERVLIYILRGIPLGQPLPADALAQRAAFLPPEAADWTAHPLIADISTRFRLTPEERTAWVDGEVDDLYRRGVCGGQLVPVATSPAGRQHVNVPLAHQSFLAGCLLALQLLSASSAELRARRPDVPYLRLPNSSLGPPSLDQRKQPTRCLCNDDDFQRRHGQKWRDQ